MKSNSKELITTTIIFPDDSTVYGTKACSFKTFIKETDKIRDIAIKLLKQLENEPRYITNSNDKWPILIKLQNSNFNINYGLNQNGNLRLLKWEDLVYYDWTYGEIRRLNASGIIDGNIKHITVEFLEGLGAAGGNGLEWSAEDYISFIESVIAIINFSFKIIEKINIRSSIKIARKNGFESPKDIRNVIERKNVWTLQEIRKLFHTDDILAATYLMGLGFTNKGKYWVYNNDDPSSLKIRAKWLEDEKKMAEEIQNRTLPH